METQVKADGTIQHIAPTPRHVLALPSYGSWLRFLAVRGHAVPQRVYVVETLGNEQSFDDRTEAQALADAYRKAGQMAVLTPLDTVRTVEAPHGELLADGRVGIPCLHCGLLTCPICGTPDMNEARECCEGYNLSLTPAERAEARALLRTRLSPMGRSAITLSLRKVVTGMSRVYIGSMVKMKQVEPLGQTEELVKTIAKPVSKAGLACKVCQGLYVTAMAQMNAANVEREAYNRAIVDIIKKDEDTVYRAALATALKRLAQPEAVKVAMVVLKGHQKMVAKECGKRGATKSMLIHATLDVKDAILTAGESQGEVIVI